MFDFSTCPNPPPPPYPSAANLDVPGLDNRAWLVWAADKGFTIQAMQDRLESILEELWSQDNRLAEMDDRLEAALDALATIEADRGFLP